MLRTLLILILAFQLKNYSQVNFNEPPKEPVFLTKTLKSDFLYSFNAGFEVLKSPLHFDNDDLLLTSLLVAATGAAMSIENQVRSDVSKMHSNSLDKLNGITEHFGRPIYGSILSGLLYSTGLIFKDHYLKETGQMLTEAIIVNGIFTTVLKATLGRARPFTNDPNTDIDFFEFEFETNENSLPSGHTSTAFTIATVLSERLDNIFASVTLYSLASLTAYQRIYTDVHWLSDVVMGAALGTFIGLKIVKLHEKSNPEPSEYTLNIFPVITPRNYEVAFSLQF
jgi:hypothetical protein